MLRSNGWFVPVHEGDTVHLGSDGMYVCYYKRADKVRALLNFIINKSYRHETIKEVYKITDQQFRDENIFNVNVLRRIGTRVYSKE